MTITGRTTVIFLFGFVCSRCYDLMLNGNRVVAPAIPNTAIDTYPSLENGTTTATSAAPRPATEAPAMESPNIATPTKQQDTGFNAIVQTAYRHAGITPVSTADTNTTERPMFDVDWWEQQSGLTTGGGLGHWDRVLLGKIYGRANSVFEWGLGESTYLADHLKVPRYAGIDSDPVWVGMARDRVAQHFRFYLGDVGPTGKWGFPHDGYQPKNILNYQLAPLIVEPQPFDVYMIDGRWRVPSLLAAFLHASDRGAPHSETIALMHDCKKSVKKSGRKLYKSVDELLYLTEHSGSLLCVYKRKQETTDEQLRDMWHEFMTHIKR